jgi:hypothetical protein
MSALAWLLMNVSLHHCNTSQPCLSCCALAGKSTFSAELSALSSRSWVRVNQDTIRNGKPGNRQACVNAAAAALAAGRNLIIDR